MATYIRTLNNAPAQALSRTQALIAAAAQNYDLVDALLEDLDHTQLRDLVHDLVDQVAPDRAARICVRANRLAAEAFNVDPDALLSPGRQRVLADARAVAQAADRALGLALPVIADYYGQHLTTVIHALRKVDSTPHLQAAAAAIAAQFANAQLERATA